MKKYFVTGIGTDVGKTIVSAILVEALKADYWKPVQAGGLDNSDTHKVKRFVNNSQSFFHESTYNLNTAASPHYAAEIDGVEIKLTDFYLPKTQNNLIIEGAGGLHVPLNSKQLIIDLIDHLKVEVVLVSQNYLGSINHTLLSIEALQRRNIPIKGIIFNGDRTKSTEDYILQYTGVKCLGNIAQESIFDIVTVEKYAVQFEGVL